LSLRRNGAEGVGRGSKLRRKSKDLLNSFVPIDAGNVIGTEKMSGDTRTTVRLAVGLSTKWPFVARIVNGPITQRVLMV